MMAGLSREPLLGSMGPSTSFPVEEDEDEEDEEPPEERCGRR